MFFNLLNEAGSVKKNFNGESIPVGMGLVFLPVIIINSVGLIVLKIENGVILGLLFAMGCLAMGFSGLLDDLLGNRNVTGLKGHLTMVLKGKLTTGGFKAIFGGMVAFFISMIISHGSVDFIINGLIIALFTNFINLLDLRPGRALKGFILSGVTLAVGPIAEAFRILLFGLLGASLAYLPYDLKAKSMMGDVGSNVLGISLGIACASASDPVRIGALLFLILLHLYTEKYSLTETIQNNWVLKYLDEIGRS